MTPERWQEIERVYHEARQREPSERTAYLDTACGGDTALRAEIESLLRYDHYAAQFIEGGTCACRSGAISCARTFPLLNSASARRVAAAGDAPPAINSR